MALLNPPVWLQAGSYPAAFDRLVTGMLVDRTVTKAGVFTSIESGVVPPLDQLRVTANGTMTVTISGGIAVVPRETSSPPGVYVCYNSGPATIVVPTAATNQRYDILVARVKDADQGDAGNVWELALITGQELLTPVDPMVPPVDTTTSVIKLARINVKSAALNGGVDRITSQQITDLRQFVSGPGGVHPNWGGPTPAHSPGRLLFRAPTNELQVSDSITWNNVLTTSSLSDLSREVHPKEVEFPGEASGGLGPNAEYYGWYVTGADPSSVYIPYQLSVQARSPSGIFEVSLAGYNGTGDPALIGFVSVAVLLPGSLESADVNAGIVIPPDYPRSIASWNIRSTIENTFLVGDDTTKNRDLVFLVCYQRWAPAGSGTINAYCYFDDIRLRVTPVL